MNLETFFEKFDQFADAPNAVAKLREFGLHLATHGKLVEQSQEDEPASNLIERISKHFKLLRNRGELGGLPVEPLETEGLPDLPSTWQWVRLGNVAQYGSPDKIESADIPSDAWLLDLEDIEKDTSRLLQRKAFRDSPSKSTKTAFAVDDVLYGKLRPYLNKALVADAPGYCTTEIVPIRTFGFVNPSYLRYALKRPEFLAYANSKSYGMNLPRLGTEDARRAAFPLPPLAEQKRIVAKVDELMALCDRLKMQLQERDAQHAALARASLARFAEAPIPANLNFLFHDSYTIEPADLRKTILTLAVQGKLSPQYPNDEAALELFRRIEAKREALISQRRIKRTSVTADPDEAEVDFPVPPGWLWTRLGTVFDVRDGTHDTPKYTDEGYPLITSKNISSGALCFDTAKFISPEDHRQICERSRVDNGDILFAMIGSIGNPVTVDTDREFSIKNVALFKYFSSADAEPRFLLHYLNFAAEAMRATAGGGVQSFVSLGFLRNYPFPLPPLAEQSRIVAKVDQLMALVDHLESQLVAFRATGTSLINAMIAELTVED